MAIEAPIRGISAESANSHSPADAMGSPFGMSPPELVGNGSVPSGELSALAGAALVTFGVLFERAYLQQHQDLDPEDTGTLVEHMRAHPEEVITTARDTLQEPLRRGLDAALISAAQQYHNGTAAQDYLKPTGPIGPLPKPPRAHILQPHWDEAGDRATAARAWGHDRLEDIRDRIEPLRQWVVTSPPERWVQTHIVPRLDYVEMQVRRLGKKAVDTKNRVGDRIAYLLTPKRSRKTSDSSAMQPPAPVE